MMHKGMCISKKQISAGTVSAGTEWDPKDSKVNLKESSKTEFKVPRFNSMMQYLENVDGSFDNFDISSEYCLECQDLGPKWISVNNGIFICLNCAGIHRGFGVQVSFVRSLEMDNISE